MLALQGGDPGLMDRALPRLRAAVASIPIARRIYRRLRPPEFDELELVHRAFGTFGGLMVDVGAHTGGSLERFATDHARHGPRWQVLAIEPDPANREVLARRYGRRPNVTIDARAIGDTDGELVTLYTSGVSSGISSMSPFDPSHRPSVQVETVRLDTLLADVPRVMILKTDTEGWDLPVLRTFPWQRMKPNVVVCEFEDRKTLPLGYTAGDLGDFLVERGYHVLVSEWWPIAEYGRRHRWRRLARYPVELGEQAWGNLIATDEFTAWRIFEGEL